MKIIFVHHAERLRGQPSTQEDGITALGQQEAQIYAEIFSQPRHERDHMRPCAIYTSPYRRCQETARIINSKLNLPIIAEPRFNEFDSQHESWVDLQTRVIAALNDITQKHGHYDIIFCVTSGVNLGAFINWQWQLPPSEQTPRLGVISCSPIIFDYQK